MQLQEFWRIVSERKIIILVTLFTTVATASLGSLLLPVKYESVATIMLDYDSSNPMNMSMVSPQALTSMEYINTQIEIIKSRRIAEGVVDLLALDKNAELITSFNNAKAGNKLLFWQSPKVLELKRWLAEEYLARRIKAESAKDSRFLYIKFYAPDPAFAAIVANGFAKSYNSYNLELKVSPFKEAGKWFSGKLKDVKGQSDKASEHLREYQLKKGIVAQQGGAVQAGAVYDDALQRLDQINKELATAKTKLYETNVALKRLEECNGNFESLPEVLSNSFVQGLKTERIKLETQLTELSGKAGTKLPQYIRLKSMLETLNGKLNNEIQTIVSALRQDNVSAVQRVVSLESAVANLKQLSSTTNLSRYEMDSLSRESESSKQAYDSILKKFSETALQGDINRTNVFLIDEAVPASTKYSPSIKLNISLSILIGLFLGIGLAILLDYLDDTIKTSEALERQFDIAVLGTIPTT